MLGVGVDIPVIGVEEWLNAHERDAAWDLAQSTGVLLRGLELLGEALAEF